MTWKEGRRTQETNRHDNLRMEFSYLKQEKFLPKVVSDTGTKRAVDGNVGSIVWKDTVTCMKVTDSHYQREIM